MIRPAVCGSRRCSASPAACPPRGRSTSRPVARRSGPRRRPTPQASAGHRLCPKRAGSDLSQLALRRPLSAPDHASRCPRLRPASANQPLGRRWHPGPIGLVFDIGRRRCRARGSSCHGVRFGVRARVWVRARARVRVRVEVRARVRVRVRVRVTNLSSAVEIAARLLMPRLLILRLRCSIGPGVQMGGTGASALAYALLKGAMPELKELGESPPSMPSREPSLDRSNQHERLTTDR